MLFQKYCVNKMFFQYVDIFQYEMKDKKNLFDITSMDTRNNQFILIMKKSLIFGMIRQKKKNC